MIGQARAGLEGALLETCARHSPGTIREHLDAALPVSPASGTRAHPPPVSQVQDPLAPEEPRAPCLFELSVFLESGVSWHNPEGTV